MSLANRQARRELFIRSATEYYWGRKMHGAITTDKLQGLILLRFSLAITAPLKNWTSLSRTAFSCGPIDATNFFNWQLVFALLRPLASMQGAQPGNNGHVDLIPNNGRVESVEEGLDAAQIDRYLHATVMPSCLRAALMMCSSVVHSFRSYYRLVSFYYSQVSRKMPSVVRLASIACSRPVSSNGMRVPGVTGQSPMLWKQIEDLADLLPKSQSIFFLAAFFSSSECTCSHSPELLYSCTYQHTSSDSNSGPSYFTSTYRLAQKLQRASISWLCRVNLVKEKRLKERASRPQWQMYTFFSVRTYFRGNFFRIYSLKVLKSICWYFLLLALGLSSPLLKYTKATPSAPSPASSCSTFTRCSLTTLMSFSSSMKPQMPSTRPYC